MNEEHIFLIDGTAKQKSHTHMRGDVKRKYDDA